MDAKAEADAIRVCKCEWVGKVSYTPLTNQRLVRTNMLREMQKEEPIGTL